MKNLTYSIVLPIRNGGEQLKECVGSILAQSFENFELIVLENCSEDGSGEWLAELNDPRVRVLPAFEPLSMMDNWARAVGIAKNEFVTFIGHDDVLDSDFLEIMSALIAENPDAGLYHAPFRFIDDAGNVIGSCRPVPARETDAEFCTAFLLSERDVNGTGYIMRTRAFDGIGGFPHFHKMLHGDHVLWLSMAHNSYVARAVKECFSYRIHARSATASAQWRDHLTAIKQFAVFMAEAEKRQDAMARVIESYAPDFFFGLCQNWYLHAVVEATQRNQKLPANVFWEFVSALKTIAPHKAEDFKHLKSLRVRRRINAISLTRTAYFLYLRLRQGPGNIVQARK